MKRESKYLKYLGVIILASMVLGILSGLILKENASVFAPLGNLFMSLIKMMVLPLVSVSIVSGAASLGNTKTAGKRGIATFLFYMGTTVVAVALGLIFGNIFNIGGGLDMSYLSQSFSDEYASRGGTPGFWDTILGFIPQNPFSALTDGRMLQILFFCLFLGFGISSLAEEKKGNLVTILNNLTEALLWMVEKVMYLAPIGVFGLMSDAMAKFGWETLLKLANLLGIYIIVILIHTYVFYPTIVKMFTKTSPIKFIRSIYKAQVVAFSTASSMGTLPVTMEVCEEDLDVSNETASFVLPLGATINMDGNAIYYALAAMFFAQMFGVELGMSQYIAIIVTATLGSIGQAGVPGPSLLVVAVLLAANIPVIGLPLLFGVDRLFDMIRTAVNITGDATCALVVDNIKE
ncbi:MAG: dicarboxylate/amino acid:cation symporter [Firmicutes bacterium]|jgi:Na+/H+-dicarboxylate symporter|nr:dicarboxylate/amino acid:cation symporter [Bacillota bacterium]